MLLHICELCLNSYDYYELPVFVLMLQTVSKCRSVFMFCVLFENCFYYWAIRSDDCQFEIYTYLL